MRQEGAIEVRYGDNAVREDYTLFDFEAGAWSKTSNSGTPAAAATR